MTQCDVNLLAVVEIEQAVRDETERGLGLLVGDCHGSDLTQFYKSKNFLFQ